MLLPCERPCECAVSSASRGLGGGVKGRRRAAADSEPVALGPRPHADAGACRRVQQQMVESRATHVGRSSEVRETRREVFPVVRTTCRA